MCYATLQPYGFASEEGVSSRETAEGSFPAWTEPIHEEMSIKSEGFSDPQPLHHRKGGAVYEAECLVWERLADVPRSFQLHRLQGHDRDASCSQGFPEGTGSRPTQVSVEEGPRFRNDEVGGDERCSSRLFGIKTARHFVIAI